MASSTNYDLTSVVGGYLDRHLIFPMLEFLSEKMVYDEQEMLEARLKLLSKTNMVDFAIDVFGQLHPGLEPEDLIKKRQSVLEELDRFNDIIQPVLNIISQTEVQEHITSSRQDHAQFEALLSRHGFKLDMIKPLYDYAKFQYECGKYPEADDYLYLYQIVAPHDHHNIMNALWGKLSCEILTRSWEPALEDLTQLRKRLEEMSKSSPLVKLQQRTWVIHWSLFVYFNHPKGPEDLVNMFLFDTDYLNAIQTTCPHILRYLAAAVIISKRRQTILKDLVKVIKQEVYTFKDPITEFVECLYVNFDFDGAQAKLVECKKVCKNDFFLANCQEELIANARLSIFETFCRIHQCISISMLAQKLNMEEENAERWIVNLIRNVKLDAKIDAQKHFVVMTAQPQSIYQRIIDKTKPVAFQSQIVAQSVTKRLEMQRQQQLVQEKEDPREQ